MIRPPLGLLAASTLLLCAGCHSLAYESHDRAALQAGGGEAEASFGRDTGHGRMDKTPDAMPMDALDDYGDLLVADGDTPARMKKARKEPLAKGGGRVAPKPADGTAVEPGRSHPLLIYTAELHMAVFETTATQQAVADMASKLGGFLAYRDDTRITIRIPARGFNDTVLQIEALGDVLHRNVQALDVTEEFRDLATRLRNAEAVRASLEKLLERANKVEDALKVQAELAKVTETIERFKGRLRFLEDRIAYSTITVRFQPRARESLNKPSTFRLPFAWLDRVGLRGLLELN